MEMTFLVAFCVEMAVLLMALGIQLLRQCVLIVAALDLKALG